MKKTSKKSKMDENLDLFLRSCFPNNWGEASWGVEIFRLNQLDEAHLNKAKADILAGLERHEGRPLSAALAIHLTEAIPILKVWLQASMSNNSQKELSGHLAHALYKLTKDEAFTPILIDTVRNAGYNYDFPGGVVTMLGELPLTYESIEAVWERLKRGKAIRHPSAWKGDCIRFMREKIKLPIGESFLKGLPESERKELLEIITEVQQENLIEQEKLVDKSGRFKKEDVNKFGEYIKIGGSPIEGMTLKHLWRGHVGEIQKLEWSHDGNYLASKPTSSAMELDSVRVWSLDRNQCIREINHPHEHPFNRFEANSLNWITIGKGLLAIGYNYSIPTSAGYRTKLTIWDVEKGKINSTLLNGDITISSSRQILSSPNGNMLLYNEGKSLYTIDITTGKRKQIYNYLKRFDFIARSDVSISPDEKVVAIGLQTDIYTQEILLLDIKSKKVITRIDTGHILSISRISWMPNQQVLAVASVDNTISIWGLRDNRKIVLLEGHAGVVTNLSFSADGKLLASKSENDGFLIIWRTDTWQPVIKLKEICRYDDQISFHPSLPILVSLCREEMKSSKGDLPYSIRVWEFDYDLFLGNAPK